MQQDQPREQIHESATRVLEDLFRYGMSPAEAVDYLAVEKAGRATGKWATIRDINHPSVSGNVSGAKEIINTARLDAEVIEQDAQMMVRVRDDEGEQHDLPFKKQLETIVGSESDTASLELIYEAMSAIHGYYVGDSGAELESTLWFDGRPTSGFEEFDFFGEWGSPEAKADTILWRREEGARA